MSSSDGPRPQATDVQRTRPVSLAGRDVLDCELRTHPGYDFVAFDAFTDEERRTLGTLVADPAYAGVLRPRPGYDLRMKAVDGGVAELYEVFAEPRPAPSGLKHRLGDRARERIVELVLADVLQIRGDGFVSGADARDLVGLDQPDDEPRGPLGRLSLAAVRHAALLELDDPFALAAQLYFFGRAPVTPRWRRRLSDSTAVRGFLGLDGPPTDPWRCAANASSRDAWLHWAARTERAPAGPLPYKMYVSPTMAALPEAMAEVLAVFAEEAVQHFKIGADAPGLARPDKLVAYFPSFAPLDKVAERLAPRLHGIAVHGVPFTSGLTDDGMLSWGLDPPDAPDSDWSERASWRSWIALRLAAGIVDARTSHAPWRHGLERLRAAGVDTVTWTPTDRYRERLWE